LNNSDKYSIRILDLKGGNHQFQFEVNDEFFNSFEDSDISKAKVNFTVNLEKNERAVRMDIDLSGIVNTQCDRCSEPFDCNVELSETLIAEFGNASSDLSDADQKIIIDRGAILLDLKKHFFDYINMSLPVRRVHLENEKGESGCNKEMLNRLESINNKNENAIEDPRWAELKKLLN